MVGTGREVQPIERSTRKQESGKRGTIIPACIHHEAGYACFFFALAASGVGVLSNDAKYSNNKR